MQRDTVNAYEAWLDYLHRVKKSNDLFGTVARQGYETDRGRILLTYGDPSSVIDRPRDSDNLPYQIWHYNTIDRLGQNNIRFVFYDPTRVSNEYDLIHSNAIGELANPRWKLVVAGNADPALLSDFDSTDPRENVGFGPGEFEDDLGGGFLDDEN